ncbi:MAG: UDP-N-acetylmuramate--L-alanine ligase [Clostridiales bacterium]|jgi:UDP-N-acetylmuramate--alanine ligase|nr:UDP-N-acetylmuramate--L-alanine ligase [Clostridiales bacterium]
MSKQSKQVHFIGIGGVSMSGLAEILHTKGWVVSGSDMKVSEITKRLELLGIKVYIGHDAKHIADGLDLVVYTAAVKSDNPEYTAASEKGITLVDRAYLLGELMREFGCPICVSGTHGKTSTTSMITDVLLAADMDPTVSVGGYLPSIGGNFRMGKSKYFVVESCEYCDSFLKFYPKIGVILNVDRDHLDYFADLQAIEDSFARFAKKIPDDGALIIHEGVTKKISENLRCKVITYGLHNADFIAADIMYNADGQPSFTVLKNGKELGRVSLRIHGEHNVLNALAACAASMETGADFDAVVRGLSGFIGAKRRFEEKGSFNGVRVIDDYAHHPAEIESTLTATAKSEHNRVLCVFQPHTYTRTLALLDEFAHAFKYADTVYVLDIYAAREKDTGLIHAKDLADCISAAGTEAIYCSSFDFAEDLIQKKAAPKDLLITIGAGDVYLLGERFVNS